MQVHAILKRWWVGLWLFDIRLLEALILVLVVQTRAIKNSTGFPSQFWRNMGYHTAGLKAQQTRNRESITFHGVRVESVV